MGATKQYYIQFELLVITNTLTHSHTRSNLMRAKVYNLFFQLLFHIWQHIIHIINCLNVLHWMHPCFFSPAVYIVRMCLCLCMSVGNTYIFMYNTCKMYGINIQITVVMCVRLCVLRHMEICWKSSQTSHVQSTTYSIIIATTTANHKYKVKMK